MPLFRPTARHCACGDHPDAHGTPARQQASRRRFAGRFFAGMGLVSLGMLARADDDLLDPDRIGASRKSAERNGLLGAVPSAAESSRRAVGEPGSTGGTPGSGGRSMAVSVVAAIDSLTRALAELVKSVRRLDGEAASLASQITQLRGDMDSKLEEYRQGLFCSGCGHTKSEILAKGESFPHAGQTVIKATDAQIAAKQAEMQAPIDRASRELEGNRKTRKKTMDERDEAISQIDPGLSLWRTGVSADVDQIAMGETRAAAAYASQRKQADAQRGKLRAALLHPTGSDLANMRSELVMWDDIARRLDAQRDEGRRRAHDGLTEAGRAAAIERNRLAEFLGRDAVREVVSTTVSVGLNSPVFGVDALGVKFRMGSFDVARHDEVLPSVRTFVNEFKRSGGGGCSVLYGAALACGPTLSTDAPASTSGALLD